MKSEPTNSKAEQPSCGGWADQICKEENLLSASIVANSARKVKSIFVLETAFADSVTFANGFKAKGVLAYACPICKRKRAHFFIPAQPLKALRIRRIKGRWVGGYLLAADEEGLRRLCEETAQRDERGATSHGN
jgi:hypothetical protein